MNGLLTAHYKKYNYFVHILVLILNSHHRHISNWWQVSCFCARSGWYSDVCNIHYISMKSKHAGTYSPHNEWYVHIHLYNQTLVGDNGTASWCVVICMLQLFLIGDNMSLVRKTQNAYTSGTVLLLPPPIQCWNLLHVGRVNIGLGSGRDF